MIEIKDKGELNKDLTLIMMKFLEDNDSKTLFPNGVFVNDIITPEANKVYEEVYNIINDVIDEHKN